MENVSLLAPMLSVRDLSKSSVYSSNEHFLVLPTRRVRISTWLQSEPFPSITVHILLSKALNNICS
jgi:hypothetical protein